MKYREILKNAAAVAALLAITLIGLEIPRGIYIQSDKGLMSNVTISEYNIDVVTEPMETSDKIDALKRDDTIIVEPEYGEVDVSEEAKASHIKYLIREVDDMLHLNWSTYLQQALFSVFNESDLYALEVITVKDDKIYSYNLGVLIFYNNEFNIFADDPGIILFDMETDKIISLEVMSEGMEMNPGYRDAIYDVYLAEVNIDEDGNVVYEENTEAYSQNESLADKNKYNMSYYTDLSAYYDTTITSDDMAYVTEYSIYACPFSVDDISSKAMSAIYDYTYEYSSKIN